MIRLASILAVLVLAFAGCGGDDEETTTSSPATTTTGATGATGATGDAGDAGLAGDPKARTDEIETCLQDGGHNTIRNDGGIVDADYQLVVDNGAGGIVYVYSDDAAASKGVPKVEDYERGAGRDVHQLGQVVIAYMKDSERSELESCISG